MLPGIRTSGRAGWRLGLAAPSPWEPRAGAERGRRAVRPASAVPRRSGAPSWFQEKATEQILPHGEHPVCSDRVLREVSELRKDRETPSDFPAPRSPCWETRACSLRGSPRSRVGWPGAWSIQQVPVCVTFHPARPHPPPQESRELSSCVRSHTHVLLKDGTPRPAGVQVSAQRLAGSPRTTHTQS